jgi:ankyrin repeat protein
MYTTVMHCRKQFRVTLLLCLAIVWCAHLPGCGNETPAAPEKRTGVDSGITPGSEAQLDERLFEVVRSNDLEELAELIGQTPTLVQHRFNDAERWPGFVDPTLLMIAGSHGWLEGVEYLIEQGASYHETTNNDINAILFSLRYAHQNEAGVADFVNRCLVAGVDPSASTPWGLSVFGAAAIGITDPEVILGIAEVMYDSGVGVRCSLDHPRHKPTLVIALNYFQHELVRFILTKQPEMLTCANYDDMNLFQSAIKGLDVAEILLLLECGADPATTTSDGSNCLTTLSEYPSRAMGKVDAAAEVIRLADSILNAQDAAGRTPLIESIVNDNILARKDGIPIWGKLLLDAGADPNLIGADGISPLHMALQQDNVNWAWLLIQYNADASLTNSDGVTARDLIEQKARLGDTAWQETLAMIPEHTS